MPELLDLLHITTFSTLRPGRGRYGIMLSDDGLILDDGVTFRLDTANWLLHSSAGTAVETTLKSIARLAVDIDVSGMTKRCGALPGDWRTIVPQRSDIHGAIKRDPEV